jgi:hypothetical protein
VPGCFMKFNKGAIFLHLSIVPTLLTLRHKETRRVRWNSYSLYASSNTRGEVGDAEALFDTLSQQNGIRSFLPNPQRLIGPARPQHGTRKNMTATAPIARAYSTSRER